MEGSCPTCTYSSGDATRYTMTSGTTGRVEEKQQLQGLNDRLGGYIRHVRDLRQQANQVDSSGFMQSIQILEDELTSLKNVYEKELDNTRRKADDLSREKSHFAVEANKNKNIAAELENRLALESDNSKRVQDDNTGLQMSLIQKEKEVDEARHAIQRPLQELDQLQRAYDDLLRDSETLKRRHNQESGELKQKMDENEQLQQKLQFSCQVHAQETRELKERLNAASTTILSLESNIRELSQSDNSLMDMLQKVRQAAEAELKRYQAEAEQTFTVNMTQIQVQLEESNRKVAELTQLNGEMQGQVGTLNTTIRSLEGKVSGLEHQKASLEDQLSSERGLSHDRMCGLERQLTQLQEALMIKMREVTAARDAHVPLKAELEAFRILLDEEEKRLKVPLGSRGGRRDTGGLTYSPHPPAPAYNARYDDSSLPPVNANMNTARMTSQPLGPVKPRSAPCSAGSMRLRAQSAQSSLGQTSDYFDDMFKDVRVNNDSLKLGDVSPPRSPVQEGECTPPERDVAVRSDQWSRPSSAGQMISPERPPSTNTYDYTTATSSATGNLKIFEVHPQGKYIRLVNTSNDKDEELGQYLLQQNVGGHPVALFRFPPRTRFPAKGTVTVWSGSQDHLLHQPPTDFVVKEQQKWGTGPECTTILCKPNGQAVAWTTAAHRFTSDNYRDSTHYSPPGSVQSDTLDNLPDSEKEQQQKVGGEPPLTEYDMHVNGQVGPTVYMQRDRSCGPSFNPPKHPHGDMPPTPTHPHTGQGRVKSHGNDNSSVNRQTRVQSSKPDPVPGAPYAGASAQRMGSSMLRRYTVRSSGGIANNS